ncbi:MAG: hypothetical protein IT437_13315 [Phycisphaerales bacterium]|nr:hypothetical protein [Phycisphaerales bacterium]
MTQRCAGRRDWAQWFTVLEEAGARTMPHAEIAGYLAREHAVRPWWSQMVTVNYEQRVLGRARHEKGGKFEVSVSRVVAAPVAAAYRAFTDAHPPPLAPGTRGGPQSHAGKVGPADLTRARATRPPSQTAAARAKKRWAARLAALRELLEA